MYHKTKQNQTKLCTYAKLNCLKKNCSDIWTEYSYWTELFEMELYF